MQSQWLRAGLLLTLLISAQAIAQVQPQVITVPVSRPGEAITVKISILSARIEVIGEDRQDAVFEVSVAEGARKIITPSGTQSLKSSAYSLEVEEEDNTITVDTDWRANKVKVLARIPRKADLELSTVNDGEIIVSNIEGKLWLENTNGPITATGISGAVLADAVNEDIKVSFDAMDANDAMSFSSVNGDLVLGMPANAGAELHIDNAQGEIYSDFEVQVQPSKPVVTRKNSRGGVEVRVESVIVANVNGGGPVIKLKTLNGDIRIEKSK